jgi:hypothetical protein
MLYGIALADGKVPPPEAKLYTCFPEYADLAKEPGRDRLGRTCPQHDARHGVG